MKSKFTADPKAKVPKGDDALLLCSLAVLRTDEMLNESSGTRCLTPEERVFLLAFCASFGVILTYEDHSNGAS